MITPGPQLAHNTKHIGLYNLIFSGLMIVFFNTDKTHLNTHIASKFPLSQQQA